MKDFPKKYSHGFEQDMYQHRIDAGCFAPESQKNTNGSCMIPMPPPNVTGVLHVGHALMLSVQDAIVRMARMQGKKTLYIPGSDHASISTQVVVERQLEKQGIDVSALSREEFLAEIRKRVDASRSTIISQTKRMGASCDWSREQFTMSEHLSRAVRTAFIKLYKEGKIYKNQYMINRSPKAKTVLSDLEVNYVEKEVNMYYIKYFVDGKGDCLTIATVRPETIFADVAVAVHPKDKRYKKRVGKHVLIPIINRSIPVIADESVDRTMGTGVLKITPTHAEVDYEIALRHDLPLDHFAITKEGTFSDLAGEMFAGKDVEDFFDNLVHHLQEIGNIEKIDPHMSKIPICDRTGCRVQPLLSIQRFMDVSGAASKLLYSLEDEKVEIHPKRFKKTFVDWLEDIRPWCISRQLTRGHRIPIWYDEGGEMYAFDEDELFSGIKDVQKTILSRIVFHLIADSRLVNPFSLEQLLEVLTTPSLVPQYQCVLHAYIAIYREKFASSSSAQKLLDTLETLACTVSGERSDTKRQKRLITGAEKMIDLLEDATHIFVHGDRYKFLYDLTAPDKKFSQEKDVLDTWFSSGLRPFSILGRPEQTPDLTNYYPNSLLETGYDIIFFRVIRMMIMGIELTGQIPFADVYLHGLVKDKYGKKMSKSVGNVMDPLVLIEKYGTDALRGSLLSGNTPGNDMKYSEEKVEYMRKFVNKLRNASRFVLSKTTGKKRKLHYATLQQDIVGAFEHLNAYDQWIYTKVQELIIQVDGYQEKFMLGEALQVSIQVIWHDFCDRYIEISKIEVSDHTQDVLLYCLGTFYKLLHPSLPFVTTKLWNYFGFTEELMMSMWPQVSESGKKDYRMNLLMEMISHRRRLKGEVTKKSHEHIDIFLQANKEIQDMVKQHELLVREILRVDEIIYYHMHEEVIGERNSAIIIDIKVGARGKQEVDKKALLKDLEKQLIQEEQFLQRLRNMFAGDFASKAPADVVAQKQAKMQEIKLKVQNIEGEIRKIKLEMK